MAEFDTNYVRMVGTTRLETGAHTPTKGGTG